MQTTTTLSPTRPHAVTGLPDTVISPGVLEVHQYAGTATIVDVRERDELTELGWIAGALHVPPAMFELWADPAGPLHRPALDPERPTVVYCDTGARSAVAAAHLRELGHLHVLRLEGGLDAWIHAGHPVAGLKPWHTGPTSPAPAGDASDDAAPQGA